jgi:nitrite reductase/ring-hydroxylating ferredoxin subunit
VSTRRVAAFVEALLGNRRPRAFKPDPQDAAAMRAAVELRAAQPGATLPRPEFVADLHHRLASDLGDDEPAVLDELASRRFTRRRLFEGLTVAAAAAAAGVVIDRELVGNSGGTSNSASRELVPDHGNWQPVAASTAVPSGDVAAFTTASAVGFVVNDGGRVSAVSGVCTHQGCLLRHNQAENRLECPCHRAAFSLNGDVLFHMFPQPLAPLPRLPVRQRGGQIEVFTPPPV